MKKTALAIKKFFSKFNNIFYLGLLIAFIATLLEVARGRNTNYFDYQDATRMFWEGLSAYSLEYAQVHALYYTYPPIFNILFAPIFYLPWWLGPFVWNLGNYSLFALAIKKLPSCFEQYKSWIFLFMLSLVLQSVFCYQYNLVVCYIFIFAFILLERGKGFWAVLLIMISTFTKIYGVAELAILLCYPKVWRNFGYAILCGAVLFFLPMLNTSFEHPMQLYSQMFDMISSHHSDAEFIGILFARGLKPFLLPNYRVVQVVVFTVLGILFFWRYKRWGDFKFREQVLAVKTGFMILFSDLPETHTYVICLPFYAMAFWLQPKRTWIDWTLFWSLVVNFCILPTDVLCPAWIHEFVHKTFWLDVYTYFFCWLRILWWAVGPLPVTDKKVVAIVAFLLLPIGLMAQKQATTRVFIVNGVTFKMKFVQGGKYMMGASENDPEADEDEVRHEVLVNNFYIGETEVTRELWSVVMGKNVATERGNTMPKEYVTFDMCKTFIERLNKMTGMKFRLPTEAEWEYAARGGRKSEGYTYSGSNNIDEVAYTLSNYTVHLPHPVAQLKPNELGLYDMSGNVWEWCEDWYRKTPEGKFSNNFHVIRGGGFDCSPRYCRSTNRFMYDQRRRRDLVGLRLAM